VRDLQTNTTTLASRASGANGSKGNNRSLDPSISGDGRFLAFDSSASNLGPADTDIGEDIFVRDMQTNTTTLASRATGLNGAKGDGTSPAIWADGRYVAFEGFSNVLNPAGDSVSGNIYVRDLQANTTTLASRSAGSTGATGNGFAENPAISADGRFVAFDS